MEFIAVFNHHPTDLFLLAPPMSTRRSLDEILNDNSAGPDHASNERFHPIIPTTTVTSCKNWKKMLPEPLFSPLQLDSSNTVDLYIASSTSSLFILLSDQTWKWHLFYVLARWLQEWEKTSIPNKQENHRCRQWGQQQLNRLSCYHGCLLRHRFVK